jgi:putative membrane protein insertion efficiency factor
VYKLFVSPFFAGSCRFEPSCSAYMAESIRVYGVASGTWRGVKRLARCRPFGGYGFDPVPRP